jgi:hypothetical protein
MSADNPYRATTAPLVDAVPIKARPPWTIWVGVGVVGLISVGVLASAMFATWKVTRAYNFSNLVAFALLALLGSVVVAMLVHTLMGRSWARIGSTVWVFALLAIGFRTQDYSKMSSGALVGSLIPPAVLLLTTMLLFLPVSNAWFRARKE